MKREMSDRNPYGKAGDETTKQIIDRALRNFKKEESSNVSGINQEKSIGEMEDEILKMVHEKIEYI